MKRGVLAYVSGRFSFATSCLLSQREKGGDCNICPYMAFPLSLNSSLYRKVRGCELVSESGEIVSES